MKKHIKNTLLILLTAFMISCSENNTDLEPQVLRSNSFEPCLIGDGCVPIGDPGEGGGTVNWPKYLYTHKGENSGNVYIATSDNETNWTTGQLPMAGTSEGPATVFFNNQYFVYYKGNSSNNIFYMHRPTPTSSWQGNLWINNSSKTAGNSISATVHNGKVWIAYVGENTDILYLAYSSDGKVFTQVQPGNISITPGTLAIPKDQFTIASTGNRLYIFTAPSPVSISTGSVQIYWYYSSTPAIASSWNEYIAGSSWRDYFSPNVDLQGIVELNNGLSATSINGEIYLAWAYAEKIVTTFPPPTEKNRKVCWAKLETTDTFVGNLFRGCNYATKRRPGITESEDGNLLISFIGNSSDRVNILKVSSSNGSIIRAPFESGGKAKVGGVQITKSF